MKAALEAWGASGKSFPSGLGQVSRGRKDGGGNACQSRRRCSNVPSAQIGPVDEESADRSRSGEATSKVKSAQGSRTSRAIQQGEKDDGKKAKAVALTYEKTQRKREAAR
jgi:hypothetical protein